MPRSLSIPKEGGRISTWNTLNLTFTKNRPTVVITGTVGSNQAQGAGCGQDGALPTGTDGAPSCPQGGVRHGGRRHLFGSAQRERVAKAPHPACVATSASADIHRGHADLAVGADAIRPAARCHVHLAQRRMPDRRCGVAQALGRDAARDLRRVHRRERGGTEAARAVRVGRPCVPAQLARAFGVEAATAADGKRRRHMKGLLIMYRWSAARLAGQRLCPRRNSTRDSRFRRRQRLGRVSERGMIGISSGRVVPAALLGPVRSQRRSRSVVSLCAVARRGRSRAHHVAGSVIVRSLAVLLGRLPRGISELSRHGTYAAPHVGPRFVRTPPARADWVVDRGREDCTDLTRCRLAADRCPSLPRALDGT